MMRMSFSLLDDSKLNFSSYISSMQPLNLLISCSQAFFQLSRCVLLDFQISISTSLFFIPCYKSRILPTQPSSNFFKEESCSQHCCLKSLCQTDSCMSYSLRRVLISRIQLLAAANYAFSPRSFYCSFRSQSLWDWSVECWQVLLLISVVLPYPYLSNASQHCISSITFWQVSSFCSFSCTKVKISFDSFYKTASVSFIFASFSIQRTIAQESSLFWLICSSRLLFNLAIAYSYSVTRYTGDSLLFRILAISSLRIVSSFQQNYIWDQTALLCYLSYQFQCCSILVKLLGQDSKNYLLSCQISALRAQLSRYSQSLVLASSQS